ncbi:MAG: S41 family peptidase [bacterium]|nr:S41 family peptidase [bacterium]
MIKSILVIVLFTVGIEGISFAQSELTAKEDVLKDLELLRSLLIEAHIAPFAYTSEEAFEEKYEEVRAGIQADSLNDFEIISRFQRLASVLNNGHTEIDFPARKYIEDLYAGARVFPYELAFEQGKALVRKDWSKGNESMVDWEVLSIDGRVIQEILEDIYPQISAERTYFKNAKIEFYSFPRYYWQVFGQKNRFVIELRNQSGQTKTVEVGAILGMEEFEMQRDEVLKGSMEVKVLGNVGYLNPGDLSGDLVMFQQYIDSAFLVFKESNAQSIILDLRNNRGGDDVFGDYIVSYFADRPFRWNKTFELRTSAFLKEIVRAKFDTSTVYNQQILKNANGTRFAFDFGSYEPQPEEKRFGGDVYVLVNRQSYSQSSVTAAQIQDYGFGTIVGEETGEFPSLYAAKFTYVLPRTKIPVGLSKGHIVRVNGNTDKKGVIPDWTIQDHLLDEKDEILDTLLQELGTL